jgi:hypothetical protein
MSDTSTASGQITVEVGPSHAEGWCTKLGIPHEYAPNLVPLLQALYRCVVIDLAEVEEDADDPSSPALSVGGHDKI